MRQRRPQGRVTIDDLAETYDRTLGGKPARRAPGSNPAPRPVRSLTSGQGDVRLARLKARADGIRFALQYENQSASKAKLLRQTLQNLELAIRGMEMTQRES